MYGISLARRVLADDRSASVVAVDDFSRHYPGGEPLTAEAERAGRIEVVRNDYGRLTTAELERYAPDAVVHLAARISVPESMRDPEGYFQNNETGTFRFAHAVAGMRRPPLLVFASSPEVYGAPVRVPMDEDHPLHPRTVYAVTKAAAELHCLALHRYQALPVVVIRNFNTYGPHQNLAGYPAVIPTFVSRALRDEPLHVEGGGTQTRDFVYIGDAVDAYSRVLAAGSRQAGSVFNIGTGVQTSIRTLAETIVRVTGSHSELIVSPERRSDLPALCADIGRIQAALGWEPRTPLDEGLTRLAEWLRSVGA
jgi:UDP-glucose 4-epimerase